MYVVTCFENETVEFKSIIGIYSTRDLANEAISICQNMDKIFNYVFDYESYGPFTLDNLNDL